VGAREVEDDDGADRRGRARTDFDHRSSGVFTGKNVSADITVTAFDPPRRFSIRSDQHQEGKKDTWYQNDYTLTPDGVAPR
jgi:hypothetical protein